jgi:hypothetical protein
VKATVLIERIGRKRRERERVYFEVACACWK